MKNRILGITVLLAVLVLGLAFIVSCGPGADTELVFINQTSLRVTLVTDGSPANVTLEKAAGLTDNSKTTTVTKQGSDVTISSFKFEGGAGVSDSDWVKYVELDVVAEAAKKQPKSGIKLGSGTVVFKARTLDDDGNVINGNPAGNF